MANTFLIVANNMDLSRNQFVKALRFKNNFVKLAPCDKALRRDFLRHMNKFVVENRL